MTAFLPSEPPVPQPEPFPADLPAPPPAEWMPLDEIGAVWGLFGARNATPAAWLATSSALAALMMETEAYQHTCTVLDCPSRTVQSREAAHAALCALDDVLVRWQMALHCLDHLRRHPAFFNEGDEQAEARLGDLHARSRWHLLRVSRLQARLREEWIVQALWPSSDGKPEQEEEARS